MSTTHPQVALVQSIILDGQDLGAADSAFLLLEASVGADLRRARRLVAAQHFHELRAKRERAALQYLRAATTQLAGDEAGRAWARRLAATLLRPLGDRALVAESRRALAAAVQACLPGHLSPPAGRLEVLLEQALEAQVGGSALHNQASPVMSLFRDYGPSRAGEQLPSTKAQVLFDHEDEVWHLAFSHAGTMLASASRDCTAVLWDVRARRAFRRCTLTGHDGPIAFLAWSPDDSHVATCSQDLTVRVWAASDGQCCHVLRHHVLPVTCAAWLPGGKTLVTGGQDEHLCVVDLAGVVQHQWNIQRVQEVLLAKKGRYILATSSERCVKIYDLVDYSTQHIQETETLLSMSLSLDSRYLLVNLTNSTIHMYDLGQAPDTLVVPLQPMARFKGPETRQRRFVVRSCLGGVGEKFVMSGSEDGKVYIYQRSSTELLMALEGHTGTVNAVAWNPTDPGMAASASDDRTIAIWLPEVSGTDTIQ